MDNLLKAGFDLPSQDGLAALGAEDEMIVDQIDPRSIMPVFHSVDSIASSTEKVKGRFIPSQC